MRLEMERKGSLCVLHEGMPNEEFGVRLFGKVYQEVSACVAESGGVMLLQLFDTTFALEVLAGEWRKDVRYALYTNHPEGDMTPREADLRNLVAMPTGTEMYIVCEEQCIQWTR